MLRPIAPFALAGLATVVLGGLVAAASGPAGWTKGSWAAAYLVLVTGVAQFGFGAGQAMLAAEPPSAGEVLAEFACWNLGSLLVVVGQLLGSVWAVVVGSVLLVVALLLFLLAVRGTPRTAWVLGYLGLVALLLVSIPVGVALSMLRA